MFDNIEIDAKVSFRELSQYALRDEIFKVSDIYIYEFENVTNRVLIITNSKGDKFYISYIEDVEQIAISRILTNQDIKSMFDIKELSLIFSSKIGFNIFTYNIIPSLNEWIETKYAKDFDYVIGKYYSLKNPKENCEFYYYTIGGVKSSIDVEVFDHDHTVFYSTLYIPKNSILV